MIGEFLYALSARDGQSPVIEPHYEITTSTLAQVNINLDHTVEPGFIYILKHVLMRLTPGSGQGPVSGYIGLKDPAGNITELAVITSNNTGLSAGPYCSQLAATLPVALIQPVNDLILPQGWSIRANGVFTAGALANSVILSICALRLPRGNISAL